MLVYCLALFDHEDGIAVLEHVYLMLSEDGQLTETCKGNK
jgi:hypothetical protein